MDEINEIFRKLLNEDPPLINQIIPDKKFYFVIGHMRTGGTYFLKQLMKLNGLELKNFNLGMVHDSCPTYPNLRLSDKEKSLKVQLYYELAQFLYWVRKEYEGSELVFKKRMGFAHILSVLDRIFGDSATYIITIRHPAFSAQSFLELEEIQDTRKFDHPAWKKLINRYFRYSEEDWAQFDYYQKFLLHWTVYYLEISSAQPVSGEVLPLKFGDQYEKFLKDFSEKNNEEVSLDSFDPKDRERGDQPSKENVRESLVYLRRHWENNNLKFPDFSF